MGAPSYSTRNYDNAAKKFTELSEKYTGNNGQQTAATQAGLEAKAASEKAGVSATNQALNAGYSRSKAAMMGANASANQFNTTYNKGFDNAAAMNNQAMNNASTMMTNQSTKDENRYKSDSARYGAALGTIGGLATAAANVASDYRMKDIKEVSSSSKCDELLAKLKGGK